MLVAEFHCRPIRGPVRLRLHPLHGALRRIARVLTLGGAREKSTNR